MTGDEPVSNLLDILARSVEKAKAAHEQVEREPGADAFIRIQLPTLPKESAHETDEHTARVRGLFPRLDWRDLWAQPDEDEYWHRPLLPARRNVVIYSPPKVGKSLLVLELAVALSRGLFWLGYQIERRYRVLYVDLENDPRGDIRTRLQDMGYEPDDLDHLDYLSFPTFAVLDSEQGGIELTETAKVYGADVVIIDTVSRTVAGEENANDTWNKFYRHTGMRLKQLGIALIRLDHTGKDITKGMRGGSAKGTDPDAIWFLSQVGTNRYRLELTFHRLPITPATLTITRHTDPMLRHTTTVSSLLTGDHDKVADLARLLDQLDVPADAGRDTIRDRLKLHGVKARNDVLADVARYRKARKTVRDSRPGTELSPDAGTAGDSREGKDPK